MTLKELVMSYKRKTGMNNTEIAEELQVTKATVSRWLSGDVKHLQSDTMQRMSEMMGYDVKAVLEGKVISFRKPVYQSITASTDFQDNTLISGDFEVTASENELSDFIVTVKDLSMAGVGLVPGTYVLVRRDAHLTNNQISLVALGSEEAIIRRVVRKRDLLILEAANEAFPNLYFTNAEARNLPVKVIGAVVAAKINF